MTDTTEGLNVERSELEQVKRAAGALIVTLSIMMQQNGETPEDVARVVATPLFWADTSLKVDMDINASGAEFVREVYGEEAFASMNLVHVQTDDKGNLTVESIKSGQGHQA